MADKLVSIVINNATFVDDSYDDEDELITYYETDGTIKCYLNDASTPETSGPVITYSMYQNGHVTLRRFPLEFCEGNNRIYFLRPWDTTSFPYAQKQIEYNAAACTIDPDASTPDVSDLAKYGNPIVSNATNTTTADGTVTLQAYSTDANGVKWDKQAFDYSTQGQFGTTSDNISTITFSGLLYGSHVFYARDSLGGSIFYVVYVDYDQLTVNYGEKYHYDWYNERGRLLRARVFKKGFSGSSTEIIGGSTPATLEWRMSEDEKFYPRMNCTTTLNFVATSYGDYLSDFVVKTEREWRVEIYDDPSGDNLLIQKGWALPGEYTEPYDQEKYEVTVNFTDGMADLEDQPFLTDLEDPDSKLTGLNSLINILAFCLRKTGLEFGIRSSVNIFEQSHDRTSSDDPLAQTYVEQEVYYDKASFEPLDCREIIGRILQPFGARVFSYGGYWYIEEVDGKVKYYSVDYDNESGGPFTVGERLTFSGGGEAELINLDDNGTDGTINFKMLKLPVPANDETVTGEDSSATCDINGTPEVTLHYREFNSEGTYVDASTYTPVVDFGQGSQSSRIAIIQGGNRLRFDDVYYKIKTTEQRRISYNILPTFSEKDESGFYPGWTRVLGYAVGEIRANTKDGRNVIDFALKDGQLDPNDDASTAGPIDAYVYSAADVTYQGVDTFSFKFSVFCDPTLALDEFDPPYVKVRFRVSVGTNYLLSNGTWSTTPSIIEYNLSEYKKWVDIEITGDMPATAAQTNATMGLRIYDCDPYYSDYSSFGTSVATASQWEDIRVDVIEAISTTTKNDGYRIIFKVQDDNATGNDLEMFYYELTTSTQSTSGADYIEANDDGDRVWVLKERVRLTDPATTNIFTVFDVADVNLTTKPSGEDIPETKTWKEAEDPRNAGYTNSPSNRFSYEVDLYHFDADPSVNNSSRLIRNIFKLSSGSKTNGWGVDGKKIQDLLGETIAKQFLYPAKRIDWQGKADVDVTPISLIRDTTDDNRLYESLSLRLDLKRNEHSGEIIEVGSDTEVVIKEHKDNQFSSAFS